MQQTDVWLLRPGSQKADKNDDEKNREPMLLEYDVQRTASIVRDLRKQKGVTQAKAAEGTTLSLATYQSIEQGRKGVSIDTICALANYYNTSVDFLLTGRAAAIGELCRILEGVDPQKMQKIIMIVSQMVELTENNK